MAFATIVIALLAFAKFSLLVNSRISFVPSFQGSGGPASRFGGAWLLPRLTPDFIFGFGQLASNPASLIFRT